MQDGTQAAQPPYFQAKVLVTGADGFIGSHLVQQLVDAGAQVTALCQYNSFDSLGWIDDLTPETRRRLCVTRGDVRDPAFMRRLVVGQEIVFHLAALIAIPYSYVAAHSYVETNVVGTLNVLEAARESGVGRVVHTSTSEVYGSAISVPISEDHPLQGQSPYSASKIGADMLAEVIRAVLRSSRGNSSPVQHIRSPPERESCYSDADPSSARSERGIDRDRRSATDPRL